MLEKNKIPKKILDEIGSEKIVDSFFCGVMGLGTFFVITPTKYVYAHKELQIFKRKETNATYNGDVLQLTDGKQKTSVQLQKNDKEIAYAIITGKSVAPADYIENNMCPFTIAQIGGTSGYIAGLTMENYTWKHLRCMGGYCKFWDNDNSECSINLGMKALYKKREK
jgi:hypothetical protein